MEGKMGTTAYNFGKEAAETSAELSKDIERLKPIPAEELKKLLPNRVDQKQLKKLIKAVHAETDKNRKEAVLAQRLGTVAAAVKDVVSKIIDGAIKFV
jgi:hypothetical protein